MSPRSEEANAIIKDERREQILRSALKVFATNGFAAATITDIATEGKISQGLVYRYFSSKDEIFFELLERAMKGASQAIAYVDSLPIRPVEKVRLIAKSILHSISETEQTAYYFLIEVHASIMESLPIDKRSYFVDSNSGLQTFVHILREGQKAGEIREGDPLSMAQVFFSAIDGLSIYKLRIENFPIPDPELLVHIVSKL